MKVQKVTGSGEIILPDPLILHFNILQDYCFDNGTVKMKKGCHMEYPLSARCRLFRFYLSLYTLTQSISIVVMPLIGLSRPPERSTYIGSWGTSAVCTNTSVLFIFQISLSDVHSRE
jgi:hypothetical protein